MLHFDPLGDLLNILFSFLKLVFIEVWVVFYKKIHILRGLEMTHSVYFVTQKFKSGPGVENC